MYVVYISVVSCGLWLYVVYNYKMADDKGLPVILDGTFFKIIKEVDNKVIAKCVNCPNNELSGARNATSNFLRHLRVSINISIFLVVLVMATKHSSTGLP